MKMSKSITVACATIVSLAGVALLVRVLVNAAGGALVGELFPASGESWGLTVWALVLSLPVPLHVISVGLILRRRWLSPRWKRGAWRAVAVSGCWLGMALAVKVFLLV